MHRNSIDDPGYVKFLNHAIIPAKKYLDTRMSGLDFGCGPTPTLSKLLAREGYRCDDYDPLFHACKLKDSYDFIFTTETVEHFRSPAKEFARLAGMLSADGILVVMTELWKTKEEFAKWHYTMDATHIAFYSSNTMHRIGKMFDLEPVYEDDKRVVVYLRS